MPVTGTIIQEHNDASLVLMMHRVDTHASAHLRRSGGHDSKEDAVAAMQLVLFRMEQGTAY